MFQRSGPLAVLAALLGAGACAAGPAPILAPPAPWVLPAPPVAASPPPDGAAQRALLWDEQLRLQDGGEQIYLNTRVRLQTAQGVQADGALALPWNPELGDLTIHWLRVIRDGHVRDVLANQSFQVLHRETNLEASVIDGVLTAAIQPDDLRVGDVVDLAFTLSNRDPAMAGHAQSLLTVPNFPIDSLRLAASAPKGTFRWRANAPLAGLPPSLEGSASTLSVAMTAVQPLQGPEGAPPRFLHPRELEVSDLSTWAEAAAILAPAFEAAETIRPGSPLAAEVARIAALSPDPKPRAQAALDLVQDQIRYLALNIHDGGLLPADAETTWARRFGDCKAKTVLLVALLHALGVDAAPVLVSTVSGDGLEARLPSLVPFDHVIVRGRIGDRVYWLDGTRIGDKRLDDIQVPGFIWALPIQRSGGALTRLVQPPLARPASSSSMRLDASAGLDAPAAAHGETVFRGDAAIALNAQLAELGTSRDQVLRAFWRKAFDFVTPTKVDATFDPATNEERLTIDGTAAMDWGSKTNGARRYETDHTNLGWKPDFTREPGPHADAPFAVEFPLWNEATETIVLPNGGDGFRIDGEDVDQQIAGRAFQRHATLVRGVFQITASTRSVAPEFPASEAASAAKALEALSKTAVYVRAPTGYKPTPRELAALMAQDPQTAQAHIDRGVVLMDANRNKEAIVDFEAATKLDPTAGVGFADLSLARFWTGDLAGARADLSRAQRLAPDNPITLHAAGMIAVGDGDEAAAVTAFSRALQSNPADLFARERRAAAYLASSDYDHALEDIGALLTADPARSEVRALRISIELAHGKSERALPDAREGVAVDPHSARPHVLLGATLAQLGRRPEAMSEFARALQIGPTQNAYLTRERFREDKDLDGKLSDLEAARGLGAAADRIGMLRAEAEAKAGAFAAALADADLAVAAKPDDTEFRYRRARIRAEAHEDALASADFAWIRERSAGDALQLNNLCYSQATVDVSLQLALADCDKALAAKPTEAAFLDSRAFVLLRLGRLDDAIAAYGAALRLQPKLAESLYGRAIAELRSGAKAQGDADLSAARAEDPRIDETFSSYGVKP